MLNLFLAFVAGAGVAYCVGRIQAATKNGASYWKGRGDGWTACENMVLDRSEENPHYVKRDVFDDLLR